MGEMADWQVDQMVMPDEGQDIDRRDYSDTVHCPECGRFVRSIVAKANDLGLTGVSAKCKVHGSIEPNRFVDGEQVGWSWDDFFGDYGDA